MSVRAFQLETERLILRPPVAADFEPWAAFSADEEATRYIGGIQVRPVAWRSFLTMVGAWQIQGFGFFSVIEKASGRWVGRLGPWMPDGWPGTEIGWSIVRDVWGKGYATEGAIATMDWALTTLGWSEPIHTIDPANEPSKAVARRLGSRFLRMGRLPAPADFEVEIWGQSREQWFARNPAGGKP